MKQLYHVIKFYIGLQLLAHDKLYFIDIWYYDYELHKECVLTFIPETISSSWKRWKRDLLKGVSDHKYRITYVHFGDTML